MNSKLSAHVTRWCTRVIFLVVAVLLFAMPGLVSWYKAFRELGPNSAEAILIGFYCCAPVVFYALWCIERLVSNILKEEVFVHGNVSYLRRLRWCCALVGLICIPAACFYMPLIFLVLIMAFLSLMVNVVCQVFKAAVALREENDLTI